MIAIRLVQDLVRIWGGDRHSYLNTDAGSAIPTLVTLPIHNISRPDSEYCMYCLMSLHSESIT